MKKSLIVFLLLVTSFFTYQIEVKASVMLIPELQAPALPVEVSNEDPCIADPSLCKLNNTGGSGGGETSTTASQNQSDNPSYENLSKDCKLKMDSAIARIKSKLESRKDGLCPSLDLSFSCVNKGGDEVSYKNSCSVDNMGQDGSYTYKGSDSMCRLDECDIHIDKDRSNGEHQTSVVFWQCLNSYSSAVDYNPDTKKNTKRFYKNDGEIDWCASLKGDTQKVAINIPIAFDIKIYPSSITLKVGDSQVISVVVLDQFDQKMSPQPPMNARNPDPSIASITAGPTIKANSVGDVTIAIKGGGVEGNLSVHVIPKSKLNSLMDTVSGFVSNLVSSVVPNVFKNNDTTAVSSGEPKSNSETSTQKTTEPEKRVLSDIISLSPNPIKVGGRFIIKTKVVPESSNQSYGLTYLTLYTNDRPHEIWYKTVSSNTDSNNITTIVADLNTTEVPPGIYRVGYGQYNGSSAPVLVSNTLPLTVVSSDDSTTNADVPDEVISITPNPVSVGGKFTIKTRVRTDLNYSVPGGARLELFTGIGAAGEWYTTVSASNDSEGITTINAILKSNIDPGSYLVGFASQYGSVLSNTVPMNVAVESVVQKKVYLTNIPPTGFVASPSYCSNNWVNLSWNAVDGATSYQVYRDGALVYEGPALAFSDTNLAFSSTHSYTLKALNDTSVSPAVSTTGKVSSLCSFVVSTNVGPGGTISPTSQLIISGSKAIFTISSNIGQHVVSVKGCEGTLSGSTYTTGAIMGECTISVLFFADSANTVCQSPLSETQTVACPSGQTGHIIQTHTKSAYPSCTFGSWTTTSNTCVVTPTTTTTNTTCTFPLAETQTIACPSGQTGHITQTHTKSAYPSCTFGSWTTTSNTCASAADASCPSPLSETQTVVCPSGQTGSIVQVRTKSSSLGCLFGSWATVSNTCASNSTNNSTPLSVSSCAEPLSEQQIISCPTGQTGSILQVHTKSAYPGCSFGSWITASNSCFVANGSATALVAPTGLTASAGACNSGEINLSWGSVSGAASYTVERSTLATSGFGNPAGSTGIVGTSFSDNVGSPNINLYYRVKAVNGSNISPVSNPVNISSPASCANNPTVSISSSANPIASGQSVNIIWSSTDTTSCSAYGGWSGNKSTSGTETVGPLSQTTTYNISCAGNGINAGNSTIVNVVAQGADTIHPNVSITSPQEGATVSGLVNISANATDNVGIARVQFAVDGVNLGSPIQSAPFSMSWNSTTVSNGPHSVQVTVWDQAGNDAGTGIGITVSNPVTFINNTNLASIMAGLNIMFQSLQSYINP